MEKPTASSTPTTMPLLQPRRGIRDNNSVQSPIDTETSPHRYNTRKDKYSHRSPERSPEQSPKQNKLNDNDSADSHQNSEGEGFSSDGDHFEAESRQPDQQGDGSNLSRLIFLGVLTLIVALGSLYLYDDPSPEPLCSNLEQNFRFLEKEFSRQDVDFWLQIRVAIKEITVIGQPRTILFLYNSKAESTLNKILRKVSHIALCHLSEETNKAVVIEGASLNTSEIVNDYGKIISNYRESLEKNGVMIVKNLEKVPGKSAQAFHSFCDDYNPAVEKALIIFTLKVDRLPEGYPMSFVEQFLLKLWSDIGKDDKFYPLFTRISGTILPVRPE